MQGWLRVENTYCNAKIAAKYFRKNDTEDVV